MSRIVPPADRARLVRYVSLQMPPRHVPRVPARRTGLGPASLFALILVALTALGCVPAVQLKSAQLKGPTPTGVRFDCLMAVENPNTFDLEVRAVRANVRIENVRGYVPVYTEPRTWIPAGRTVIVAVPITIPYAMVPSILAATVRDPKVTYTVIGNADVTATRAFRIEQDMYQFDEEGTLPRSLFLNAGSGGISIGTR